MDDNDLKIVGAIKHLFHERPIIFDIGANRGNYTDYVLSLIPDAKMVLAEPNQIWKEHLYIKYHHKGYRIFNDIIGNKHEVVPFYYFTNNNDQLSSIYKRPIFDDLPMQETREYCRTIDNILDFCSFEKVDFIKVDTEGAEFDVLKGSAFSLLNKKINFIQIEYGGTYPDAGITMKEIIRFVNEFGYNVYSYDKTFEKLDAETFVEDFHYDNYLITHYAL